MLSFVFLTTAMLSAQRPSPVLDHSPLNRGDFDAVVRLVSMGPTEERVIHTVDGDRTGYFRDATVDVMDSTVTFERSRVTLLLSSLPPKRKSGTGLVMLNPPPDPELGTVWLVVGRRPHTGQVILKEEPVRKGVYKESLSARSDDECSVITMIATAAKKLVTGKDATTTILRTLVDSLPEVGPQNVAATTRFLTGFKFSGWAREVDSVPLDSWLQGTVAPVAFANTAGKDRYTQMRLFALAAQLGKTDAQILFFRAFTDNLGRHPEFFDANEASDLQNVMLYESVVSADDLVNAADRTRNYRAKSFLLGRSGFPKSEASYQRLIRMLDDDTVVNGRPFYVEVLGKMGLLSERRDLEPEPARQGLPPEQWQRLRAFWKRTSLPQLKTMRAKGKPLI
ncbi:MAG: hypothetical protein ACHQ50_05670 [Fimbriimonadales bacterium]